MRKPIVGELCKEYYDRDHKEYCFIASFALLES
jgi:hypothetical protein